MEYGRWGLLLIGCYFLRANQHIFKTTWAKEMTSSGSTVTLTYNVLFPIQSEKSPDSGFSTCDPTKKCIMPSSRERLKGIIGRGHDLRLGRRRTGLHSESWCVVMMEISGRLFTVICTASVLYLCCTGCQCYSQGFLKVGSELHPGRGLSVRTPEQGNSNGSGKL